MIYNSGRISFSTTGRTSSFWDLPLIRILPSPWLPTIVFLASYAATTVIGATYFLTKPGQTALSNFLSGLNAGVALDIGSPVYLALLILPFLLIPVFAHFGIVLVKEIAWRAPIRSTLINPPTPLTALWLLLLSSAAFCIYKLYAFDALFPQLLFDSTASYQDKIIERSRILDGIGSLFFIFTYGFIPIITIMFFASAIMDHRKFISISGFIFGLILFNILILHLYAKSHLLVFSIMLVTAVILSKGWPFHIPILVTAAFVLFFVVELMLAGLWVPQSIVAGSDYGGRPSALEAPLDDGWSLPQSARRKGDRFLENETFYDSQRTRLERPTPVFKYIRYFLERGLFFRMASSFPFYVSIFETPSERCGIEAHTLRRLLGLSGSDCALPTKVFPVMYPDVDWVTGYAPAPAHVSAYGEMGFIWSLAVMAMSGFVLGVIGMISRVGSGPLFATLGVASCTFAYYLSQVPFIAAFTYGHGLIFLSLPLVFLYIISIAQSSIGQMRPPSRA